MILFKDTFPTGGGNLVHSLPLFHELGLLKIHYIYKLQIANFVYACMSNLTPVQFKDWFTFISDMHNHSTRSRDHNLFVPYARTTHNGINSIKFQGPKIWNDIPINIRDSHSKKNFNKSLKENYLSEYSLV